MTLRYKTALRIEDLLSTIRARSRHRPLGFDPRVVNYYMLWLWAAMDSNHIATACPVLVQGVQTDTFRRGDNSGSNGPSAFDLPS
jgi:hypothetical protein